MPEINPLVMGVCTSGYLKREALRNKIKTMIERGQRRVEVEEYLCQGCHSRCPSCKAAVLKEGR